MIKSLKWRIGVLTFAILAMTFSYLNDRLQYLFDASGVTGKKTEIQIEKPLEKAKGNGQDTKKAQEKKVEKLGLVPVLGSFRGGFLCVKRKKPIKIDGDVADWELRAGQFLCTDCKTKSGLESAWVHVMYDDQGLYILGRMRNSKRISSDDAVDSDLKSANFIQLSIITDQATAINIWRHSSGKGMVQLHYYLPKTFPRETTRPDDNLFNAEDAIYRENGLKNGATVAITNHGDKNGADIECMVPWAALCRDITNKPVDGQVFKAGIGVKYGSRELGLVQLKTNQYNKSMKHAWFSDTAPKDPLPVEVRANNKGRSKVYPVMLDTKLSQLRVDWTKPEEPTRPINPVLPVTPANGITVDAQSEDWPVNGEITIAENYLGRFGATLLRAAADDSHFYLYARVGDPTPRAGGDMLKISMKTDRVHELNLNLDLLEVDGKDVLNKGATMKGAIDEEFQSYSLETKIPWTLLTANGKKPGGFPITCRIFMNPIWNVQGLVNVFSGDEQPDPKHWAMAKMMDAPEFPMPVQFVSGEVLDQSAGKVTRFGGRSGASLRNPYAVHNPALNVLPGTATVDGDTGDWDLSGGMFLCDDVRIFHDTQAVWIHAMHDEANLYLLYRFHDSSPMANASSNYLLNDMTEFFFVKDSQFMLAQASITIGGKETIHTTVKGGRAGKDKNATISSIKTVFKPGDDDRSYVQEVAIPLTLLTKSAPIKAGDSAKGYFNVRTSPHMLLGGPEKAGCYKNVSKKKEFYGAIVFREAGKIEPEPLRLMNGVKLPVRLVKGQPTLDISAVE